MSDLAEVRDRFAHDTAEWKPIRDEGTTDMHYAAGDPWDPKDRTARLKAGRPCINADELNQYVNQVVNEVRSNKRAVKFTPIGNGATDKTALFYADKMREIEYRSRAQIGYTTAFEGCVTRSFGFVRVNARYPSSRALHQDLWIDPVPNPNLITPDCEALMPDLSDMGHCWVREAWDYGDFNRKWPQQKIKTFTSDLGKTAGDWVTERRVFVGEYWTKKTTKRSLLTLQVPGQPDPVGIFEDELEDGQPLPGVPIGEARDVDDPSVVMQLTNGLEILEETPWPGKYIPIIGCLGKVLYVAESGSERRKILSMIRLARDPQMLYAYLLTNEAEVIGAMPRFPYFVYEGQLAQSELTALAESVHEPRAVIQVKPTVEGLPLGAGPLPFPQRNPYEPPLQAIEVAKEAARRAIQAAMGQTPLPTAAQRRNEKSGVALKHIDELGQRGSFHFTDHYLDMITQVGIVCEDLIDKIYDTPREVGIRKDDDTAETIRINGPEPGAISTKGDHLVTVSTGPSFDSERDAAEDFAGSLLDSPVLQMLGPQKAPQIIAKAIKLKNLGPIGDQMCEIIAPEPPNDGEPPTPEQLQQAVQQAQGESQHFQQQLQQATHIIETKQAEQQGTIEKAKIDATSRVTIARESEEATTDRELRLQEMKNAATIAVAHIAASAKGVALDAHAQEEAQALGHAQQAQALSRAHDVGMAAVDHAHSVAQAAQGHDQALEAGEQGQQHALEQGQQAADLASAPAEASA